MWAQFVLERLQHRALRDVLSPDLTILLDLLLQVLLADQGHRRRRDALEDIGVVVTVVVGRQVARHGARLHLLLAQLAKRHCPERAPGAPGGVFRVRIHDFMITDLTV